MRRHRRGSPPLTTTLTSTSAIDATFLHRRYRHRCCSKKKDTSSNYLSGSQSDRRVGSPQAQRRARSWIEYQSGQILIHFSRDFMHCAVLVSGAGCSWQRKLSTKSLLLVPINFIIVIVTIDIMTTTIVGTDSAAPDDSTTATAIPVIFSFFFKFSDCINLAFACKAKIMKKFLKKANKETAAAFMCNAESLLLCGF